MKDVNDVNKVRCANAIVVHMWMTVILYMLCWNALLGTFSDILLSINTETNK